MQNWPAWFPNPIAWLNAVVLGIVFSAILALGRFLYPVLVWLFQLRILPIQFFVIVLLLGFLTPIVVLAFVYHYLQVGLDRFAPDTRSPEFGPAEGLFPSLVGWWEGLYGWLVYNLSLYVSSLIPLLFIGFMAEHGAIAFDGVPNFWSAFQILARGGFSPTQILGYFIWGITAAYLYQLEYLVRQYFITVGANSSRR